MSATDPQFIYMILVLPTLFGLTLVGEGMAKILHHEGGLISLISGILFIIFVLFAYLFLSTQVG